MSCALPHRPVAAYSHRAPTHGVTIDCAAGLSVMGYEVCGVVSFDPEMRQLTLSSKAQWARHLYAQGKSTLVKGSGRDWLKGGSRVQVQGPWRLIAQLRAVT